MTKNRDEKLHPAANPEIAALHRLPEAQALAASANRLSRHGGTPPPEKHLLTVWNGIDVPDEVSTEIMRLLTPYDPDIYQRECDEKGRVLG